MTRVNKIVRLIHFKNVINVFKDSPTMQSPPQPSSTLVLLYSEYSEHCKKLRQMIPDNMLSVFEKVCIDSEEIRQAIMESDIIKVNEVPCFLQIYADGTVAKYEAVDAFKLIMSYVSKSKTSPMTSPSASASSPSAGLPVSSVDKILSGLRSLPQAPPMSGSQARRPSELDLARAEPDVPMRRGPRRPFQGISSERDIADNEEPYRPVRGEGHEGMRSSLAGVGRDVLEPYEETMMEQEQEAPARSVPVGRGKQTVMIQDLTPEEEQQGPNIDDDPSGMMGMNTRVDVAIAGKTPDNKPDPQPAAQMGGRGKEKSNSVKAMAAAMARAREAEIEAKNANGQEAGREQRVRTKKGAIDLS